MIPTKQIITRLAAGGPKLELSTHTGLAGKVRTRILNPDGSTTGWSPWFKNLILTAGLDALAPQGYVGIVSYAKRGTGTTAVRLNTSGTGVTLSQSGTTVTASGAFFLSTDVGNVIKYGATGAAGAETTITAYTDSTHVTVSTTATVASTDAVVWRTNQTGLVTPVDTTSTTFETDLATFDATGGGSGIPTLTMRRGYQFAAVAGPATFTELGFGWSNATSGTCYARVLVPGAGDSLTTGQIYQVEYSMQLQIPDGAAQVAVGDSTHPSGDPWSTAGTFIMEYVGTTAPFQDRGTLSPSASGTNYSPTIQAITATWTQRTLIASTTLTLTRTICDTSSIAAYSNGTFKSTRTATFNLATANVTWYGIVAGNINNGATDNWTIKFTTPIAKDASHTLVFTHTLTWGRVLNNS